MKREDIEAAENNLSLRHIQEAASHPSKSRRRLPAAFGAAAAILLFCFAAGQFFQTSPTVTAYAQGVHLEITSAGAVMQTGSIQDDGSQVGHPLMFYLAGEDIESVRFSCKNQKIRFEDWTETREEFGQAQNFTVAYGPDPSEYYYLLIDWVPEETVKALHQENTKITDLPPELREDCIVMEIQFSNGKKAVKAISISLLDDGTFYAAFGSYKPGPEDDFISRPDAPPIPREVLYGPDGEYPFGDAPVIEGTYQDADLNEPPTIVEFGQIQFTGTIVNSYPERGQILVQVEEEFRGKYNLNDTIVFDLGEERTEWLEQINTRVEIICSDFFFQTLPPIGDLISIVIVPEV